MDGCSLEADFHTFTTALLNLSKSLTDRAGKDSLSTGQPQNLSSNPPLAAYLPSVK